MVKGMQSVKTLRSQFSAEFRLHCMLSASRERTNKNIKYINFLELRSNPQPVASTHTFMLYATTGPIFSNKI